VARFIKDVILRSGRFDLRVVSLAMAASDPTNLRVTSLPTWHKGVITETGIWEGLPFVHVGALAGELEFQRYRPRKALSRVLAECDLIQVVSGSPAWANAVVGLGKPVALQVATRACIERHRRDAMHKGAVARWRKVMTQVTDWMDDRALRLADAIQVENPWMLEYSRELNSRRDVDLRYAPPGVNAEAFCPLNHREPMRDSFILCVARLDDPRKNIDLLLEAYAKLPSELHDVVRLVLAGSSGPPDAFWRRAASLGLSEKICYIERPDQNALIRLYREASVFALPSDEEGFGVVLIEAMACGVPVVSTRSGGPDGIITDGEDGYLVPLDDVAALSLRLAQLLQNATLNIGMGQKARQTIERRYDERIAGEVFIDMWDRMARKAGIA
jgi:glycosyltransferase involved in cell wall biosynthesis